MGAMFMVMGTFLDDTYGTEVAATSEPQKEEQEDLEDVEYSEMITILVKNISPSSIVGFDIKNRKDLTYKITQGTKVDDGHDNSLLVSQIKKGDIVNIVYQQDKEKVVSISKSNEGRTIKRMSGATVDTQNNKISINGSSYTYTNDTLVLTDTEELVPINAITPFDIVTMNCLDGELISVIREEEGSKLRIEGVPNTEGTFELDRSRMFRLDEIGEYIGVTPGEHRIIFDMEGYKPISEVINVGKGEVYTVSLKDAQVVYSTIIPKINIDLPEYEIKIDNKIYKKDEKIEVQQGVYTVSIKAEGYKEVVKTVSTSGYEEYELYINVESEAQPTPPSQTPIPEEDVIVDEQPLKEEQEVNLNTNPVGAKVYINGSYKGQTPCTITLKNGSYGVIFEKDGYAPYSTNIMLDGSSDKPGYLYDMIKN